MMLGSMTVSDVNNEMKAARSSGEANSEKSDASALHMPKLRRVAIELLRKVHAETVR
jgi:hypothetical protein